MVNGEARTALAVVSLDRTREASVVMAALRELGHVEALAAAEEAGHLRVRAGRVVITDPDDATAAAASASPRERRAIHAALAHAMASDQSPERQRVRAHHLVEATTEPDEAVAADIARVAAETKQRADVRDAAEWWERAAALSPDADARASRLREAGDAWFFTGEFERARAVLDEAHRIAIDPIPRADAAILLGQLDLWERGPHYALEFLLNAAEDVEPFSSSRAVVLLVHAASTGAVSLQGPELLTLGRRALAMAAELDPQVLVLAQIVLAFGLVHHGDSAEAAELLAPVEAVATALFDTDMPEAEHLWNVLGMLHVITEKWATAETFLERVVYRTKRAGAPSTLGLSAGILAELRWRTGRWDDAWELATGPLREGARQAVPIAWANAYTAHLEAARGMAESCRSRAEAALAEAEELDASIVKLWALHALALLELGLGHPAAAAAHLDRAAAMTAAAEVREPGVVWWQADHVESLWRAGRRHEAERALERFSRESTAVDRKTALAAVARSRGLLTEDHEEAEAHFVDALDIHRTVTAPFELGRVLLCRAERRIASGRHDAAKGDADEAVAIFAALGADLWTARAHALADEARAPRRDGSPVLAPLTEAERRVVGAVAEGKTNREVAAALFLSTKTVDYHLQNVFRKLGVRSRTELVVRLTQ